MPLVTLIVLLLKADLDLGSEDLTENLLCSQWSCSQWSSRALTLGYDRDKDQTGMAEKKLQSCLKLKLFDSEVSPACKKREKKTFCLCGGSEKSHCEQNEWVFEGWKLAAIFVISWQHMVRKKAN